MKSLRPPLCPLSVFLSLSDCLSVFPSIFLPFFLPPFHPFLPPYLPLSSLIADKDKPAAQERKNSQFLPPRGDPLPLPFPSRKSCSVGGGSSSSQPALEISECSGLSSSTVSSPDGHSEGGSLSLSLSHYPQPSPAWVGETRLLIDLNSLI